MMIKIFFKQLLVATVLSITAFSTASAETYWLNIPESYRQLDDKLFPASSIPTASQEACSEAMVEYAKEGFVNFIGCDVKPLPNAANMVSQL